MNFNWMYWNVFTQLADLLQSLFGPLIIIFTLNGVYLQVINTNTRTTLLRAAAPLQISVAEQILGGSVICNDYTSKDSPSRIQA